MKMIEDPDEHAHEIDHPAKGKLGNILFGLFLLLLIILSADFFIDCFSAIWKFLTSSAAKAIFVIAVFFALICIAVRQEYKLQCKRDDDKAYRNARSRLRAFEDYKNSKDTDK